MPQLQHLATLPGHSDPAWCVTFNPSRPLLASCSTDRTFRVFSYVLPQPLPPYLTVSEPLTLTPSLSDVSAPSVADPTEAPARAQQIFPRPSDPKPIFSLQSVVRTEHKRTIRSLSWAPSGRSLATGSFDSSVGVWEEVDGSEGEVDEGGEGSEGVYRPATLDKEGDDEMVGGEEGGEGVEPGEEGGGDAKSREGKEWECVTTLEGHDSECKSVAWSGDGGLLASCSRDKSVWIWEGESFSG